VTDVAASPLVEIERAVQARAKDRRLDVAAGDGIEILHDLVEDEVRAWTEQHKRGLRPYDLADPELVADRAFRNLAGYGPLAPLLADDDVWEVMINAPEGAFA
jgi:pilus assembly protein CpaF